MLLVEGEAIGVFEVGEDVEVRGAAEVDGELPAGLPEPPTVRPAAARARISEAEGIWTEVRDGAGRSS